MLAGALSISAFSCQPASAPAAAEDWTGDLLAPERPAAIGFLARMDADAPSLEVIALGAMGFSGGTVTDLRITGDTLHFTWPSSGRRSCVLGREGTGAFEGPCARADGLAWRVRLAPPSHRRKPIGHARSILARTDRRWETREFSWGRLHLGAGAPVPIDVGARGAELDASITRDLDILGASAYDRPLDAFLIADRAEILAISGQRAASTADPLGTTVLLAKYASMPTVMRHEVMHVLSINVWGIPPEPAAWVREGSPARWPA